MNVPRLAAPAVAIVISMSAQVAHGQTSNLPVRLGSLELAPTVTVSATRDSNVFNSPDEARSDVSSVVRPAVAARWLLRWVQLEGDVAGNYVRYGTYRTESENGRAVRLRVGAALARLTLFAAGSFQGGRDRRNAEVDARVTRRDAGLQIGSSLRISPRTAVELRADRAESRYGDEIVDDVNLAEMLSASRDGVSVGVRRGITPLTDLVFAVEARHDRFGVDNPRNSRSERLTVSLQSSALLQGSATVGLSHFVPTDRLVPAFRGLIVDANLRYPISTTTVAVVEVARDVTFSYQPLQPYYVSTRAGLAITRPLFLGLIGDFRASHQWLDYRAVTGTDVPRQVDVMATVTFGLARRIGRHISLGLSASREARRARAPRHSYENLRILASTAYAF